MPQATFFTFTGIDFFHNLPDKTEKNAEKSQNPITVTPDLIGGLLFYYIPNMTAIEFENISKQYRLGLVSTGTLSHDLNRFWQTKILRREDPYLKVGEVNDRASKGTSDYVWALKDINLQKPLSLGHGQTNLATALAHRVFKVEQGDVVGIIASLLEVGTGFHPE